MQKIGSTEKKICKCGKIRKIPVPDNYKNYKYVQCISIKKATNHIFFVKIKIRSEQKFKRYIEPVLASPWAGHEKKGPFEKFETGQEGPQAIVKKKMILLCA